MPQASLRELDTELQRLIAQRESLEKKRAALREEELKVLADAFARKLALAGFSIKEGIAALKPYAQVSLKANPESDTPNSVHRFNAPPPPVAAPTKPVDRLLQRAQEVLGKDAERWLGRPHALLGGQSPQQVAAMPGGLDKVHALLVAYARGA